VNERRDRKMRERGLIGCPSNGSQSLANVYDVSADYQVNPHLALTGYYAGATGRAVIQKIYPQRRHRPVRLCGSELEVLALVHLWFSHSQRSVIWVTEDARDGEEAS
jgi:hypothetical protein